MHSSTIKRWLALALLVALSGCVGLQAAEAQAQEAAQRKPKVKVTPTYPELARRMHVAGSVKMQVVIAPSGAVKTATAIGGHPLLIDAAMDAIKRWKYEPSSQETTTVVEFRFNPGN